ncbi:MAG: hypothetical protein KDC87_06475, partial [Planctomycetes bacterium]|nr:hypothetical protein [Planctomycetota bacterium]
YPNDAEMDKSLRLWFEKHLRAMSEPSIRSARGGCTRACRLLILPTSFHPVACRAELVDGKSLRVAWTVLDGEGGYEPGEIMEQSSKLANREGWTKLIEVADRERIWETRGLTDKDFMILDGTMFVLEIRDGHRYWVAARASVDRDDAFSRVAGELLRFSKGLRRIAPTRRATSGVTAK